MSDIRFNNWLHQSGTGGVYQDGSGNVGIGTSVPSANLDVEGTINANTAVISGNLTVEGVLTYDDVTNIDSVGVVTARDGIDITSGDIVLNKSRSDTHASLIIDKPDAGSGTIKFYNNGSDSGYIQHTNAEHLHYYLPSGAGNHVFYTNGANVRLSVTNTGASVTGNLNVSGHAYLNDDREIVIGAGQDLKLYHDSATGDSFIKETGSGNLKLVTSTFRLRNAADSEHIIWANQDAEVRLYHDSVKKFETTTTGVEVSGATKTDTLEVTQEYPTIRPTLDLNFAATKVLDDRITFTRDSVGTYTDENGVLKYASNNTPRFDHDPETGESLGLLIEESRTNYVDNSNDVSQWNRIINSATIESNTTDTLSPDGTNTSTKITGGSNSGISRDGVLSVSASTNYIASIFAKKGTADSFKLEFGTGANQFQATFNLTTKAFSGTSAGGWFTSISTSYVDYPNGWVRVILTGTTGGSASGSPNFAVYGISSGYAYFWGGQAEVGSFVTSLIPTHGSTVTRAADNAKITGTNFTDFYNDTEGTFFVEADTINPTYNTGITGFDGSNNNYTIVGTGDSPNRFQLRFDDQEPFQVLGFGPNSTTAITSNTTLTPTLRAKIAGAFKQDDVRGAAQGEIILTDTSFDMISPTSLFIGSLNGSSEILPGHVRKVSYYRQALPNAQLQGLTQQ